MLAGVVKLILLLVFLCPVCLSICRLWFITFPLFCVCDKKKTTTTTMVEAILASVAGCLLNPVVLFLLLIVTVIILISQSHHYEAGGSASSAVLGGLSSFSSGLFRFRSDDFLLNNYDYVVSSPLSNTSDRITSAPIPEEPKKNPVVVPDRVKPAPEQVDHHFGRSHSETTTSRPSEMAAAQKMNKSASASPPADSTMSLEEAYVLAKRQQPAVATQRKQPRARTAALAVAEPVVEEAKEDLNARADDFIKSFRQQLQLQRLNSLLNYRQMLHRGR